MVKSLCKCVHRGEKERQREREETRARTETERKRYTGSATSLNKSKYLFRPSRCFTQTAVADVASKLMVAPRHVGQIHDMAVGHHFGGSAPKQK